MPERGTGFDGMYSGGSWKQTIGIKQGIFINFMRDTPSPRSVMQERLS